MARRNACLCIVLVLGLTLGSFANAQAAGALVAMSSDDACITSNAAVHANVLGIRRAAAAGGSAAAAAGGSAAAAASGTPAAAAAAASTRESSTSSVRRNQLQTGSQDECRICPCTSLVAKSLDC